MSSTPTARASRHLVDWSFFATALMLLASCGAVDSGPASTGPVSAYADICDPAGVGAKTDVFALDEAETYSVVAVTGAAVDDDRRDTVPVNVISSDGRLIASTAPFEMSNQGVVDLVTGVQFGVAPPPVFEADGASQIRVAHDGRAYELVLVRNAADDGPDQPVRPPIGAPVSAEIDACGEHGPRSIRLDSIYANATGRQVFLISSSEVDPPDPFVDTVAHDGGRADDAAALCHRSGGRRPDR